MTVEDPPAALGRIYVIDDDRAVLESTAFLLAAHGFACETFASARDFLSAIDMLSPGCVLTDLRMPDIDGWSLRSALEERSIRWPVVLMSSDDQAELEGRALAAGFSGFVRKPLEPDALRLALERALAATAEGAREL